MGLAVRTGQIVWNQVKDELTDNENHIETEHQED